MMPVNSIIAQGAHAPRSEIGLHMRHSVILSLVLLGLGTSRCSAQQGPPASGQTHQRGKPNKVIKVFGNARSDNIPENVIIAASLSTLDKKEALSDALEKAKDQTESCVHVRKP